MVRQNLIGYEKLAGISKEEPSAETETSENEPSAASPSPSSTVSDAPNTAENKVTEAKPSIDSTAIASTDANGKQNEKVEEFLREQAAFSDYTLPANVSYEYPDLPFEYTPPVICATTSGFGYRVHPIDGDVKFHYGSDYGVVDGSDISAFADGTVISAQEFDGYGLTVILDHGNDYTTLYAHCSQILVKQGDKVKRGDKIALSGHSGRVTGPHMHFELMKNDIYLNPEFYV